MASVRFILTVASLFVVLSIVLSAPAADDVALEGLAAGSTGASGSGYGSSWQSSQGVGVTNNGVVSSAASDGTYASGALISETVTLTDSCGDCDTTLTDSYVINYQDAGNYGNANATATGQGAQAISNTDGNAQSGTSGGSGANGVLDSTAG